MAYYGGGTPLINSYDLSEDELNYELTIRDKLYNETGKEKRERLNRILKGERNFAPRTLITTSVK